MIRGVIFDINGTVIDILTNEGEENIYRVLSNFLDYQGIALSPDELRRLYFEINKRQRRESAEEYPEFDVKALFAEIVDRHATAFTHALPKPKRKVLPEVLAELFRAASRFRLEPYPDVRRVLDELARGLPACGAFGRAEPLGASRTAFSRAGRLFRPRS